MTLAPAQDPTQLFPMVVALVTTHSAEQGDNVMGIGYVGFVCWQPPIVALGINTARHSGRVILDTREFVVAIPDARYAHHTDFCGSVSGSQCDKLRLSGFTVAAAEKVRAPLLTECLLNLECRLRDCIPLGSHSLYLGEVVATHKRVDEESVAAAPMVLIERCYVAARDFVLDFGASCGAPPE